MALPCPGPAQISLADIQTEFGGTNPISLNEYYRNGSYVTSNNTNVPTSGQISFDDFFCAIAEIVVYITVNTENVDASSYFNSSDWSSSVPKRLVVNSGVTLGATNTSNYAISVPSGFGGNFQLDNNGFILGAGGAGGDDADGEDGGNAVFAGDNISINNQGTISAGGGGGGAGGDGGGGYYTSSYSYNCDYCNSGGGSGFHYCGSYSGACSCQNPSAYSCNCNRPNYGFSGPLWACCDCTCCYRRTCTGYNTNYTSGGDGGTGGKGQGYDGAATAGAGGVSGGTNAGTGGDGGDGGSYGQPGDDGETGGNGNNGNGLSGYDGGLSGYYIVNNSNVTWISNGTRNGRVG